MCARRTSAVFGTILEAAELAFAQPTADGAALARRFTGVEHFYTY